jgi:hypothetical protein
MEFGFNKNGSHNVEIATNGSHISKKKDDKEDGLKNWSLG